MRKGHGPGGIIGMTENPQTMARWVFSMDATMTLTGDLKKMSGDDANVQTTHNEEAESRINRDGHDRQSLRAALESRIDPMYPVTHAAGCLINISNGQIAQPNVNVDRALEVGREQLKQFEALWPAGFYNTLSKQVVTFAERKKRLSVGESAIVDQEAIYALVNGLLVSQRDLDLQSSMTMESPIHGRSCIDIKETARQHDAIIPAILPLHALTGCDSVAATYGLGKTKAITVARK